MDKLINDLEKIISDNLSGSLFDDVSCAQNLAISLSFALSRFKARARKRQASNFLSKKEINSFQLLQVYSLVDLAARRWKLLLDDKERGFDFSVSDAYRYGFVNAVLCFMKIFDIDEKLVKK